MGCRFAPPPTRPSPVLGLRTTDGGVPPASAFGITTGSPASNVLTTELVVPRSMPTALAMSALSLLSAAGLAVGRSRRRPASLGRRLFLVYQSFSGCSALF